jgi:hypothetical protein
MNPPDLEVVESFMNFLSQAGSPGSKPPADPQPHVALPWSPALYAYAWGLTTNCPPPGEL